MQAELEGHQEGLNSQEAIDEGFLDRSILDSTDIKTGEEDAGIYYDNEDEDMPRRSMNTQMLKAKILGFDRRAQKQASHNKGTSPGGPNAGANYGPAHDVDSAMENTGPKNGIPPLQPGKGSDVGVGNR